MSDFTPVRKKLLTRPVFKWTVGKTLHCRIESAMHVGKEIKSRNATETDKKKEPATLCNVTDLSSGELGQFIANTVIKSTLDENYPNDTYVGLCFSITKQARQEGKQYDKFSIEEIDDPDVKKDRPDVAHDTAAAVHAVSGKRR